MKLSEARQEIIDERVLDPICGNCGKKKSFHYPPKSHCWASIAFDDRFTSEPSSKTLLKWMEARDPYMLRHARTQWKIENGHQEPRGEEG